MKCAIQWVDRNGIPTPDDNDATLVVQIKAHYSEELERCGAVDCNVKASAWLPCCDNHAKRMNEPGMRYWVSKPMPCDYGEETAMSNVYRDCEFCDAPAEMDTARCTDHELLPDNARWCVSCEDWRYGPALHADNGCICCWNPTMSRADKEESER